MDELGLSWPELSLILVWVVGATVFVIQKIKQFVCCQFKGSWTQKIPWWAWLALSLVVPFGMVVLIAQQWAQDMVNAFLPPSMQLSLSPEAILPTALSATLGANGSYAVAKRLGLAADYSPGGPNDVTPAPVSPIVPVSETGNTPVDVQPEITQETYVKPEQTTVNPVSNSTQDTEQSTDRNGQESQQPSKDAGNSIQYVEPLSTNPAYLLNYCDTDPDIGPHVVLLDGKLYRVDHGKAIHLRFGW